MTKFNKAVSKVKTKPEMIKSLIKKLEKYRKDIYSDEDKESDKELIHKFKIGAKEDSSKEASRIDTLISRNRS